MKTLLWNEHINEGYVLSVIRIRAVHDQERAEWQMLPIAELVCQESSPACCGACGRGRPSTAAADMGGGGGTGRLSTSSPSRSYCFCPSPYCWSPALRCPQSTVSPAAPQQVSVHVGRVVCNSAWVDEAHCLDGGRAPGVRRYLLQQLQRPWLLCQGHRQAPPLWAGTWCWWGPGQRPPADPPA